MQYIITLEGDDWEPFATFDLEEARKLQKLYNKQGKEIAMRDGGYPNHAVVWRLPDIRSPKEKIKELEEYFNDK
jgi:hypothetical protein